MSNKLKRRKKQIKQESKNVFFDSMESFLKKRGLWIFALITLIFTILCFGLFAIHPDTSGDDTEYIVRGYNFIHHGSFPSFQGPLYPIFLSLFIWLVGVDLIFLKSISLVCLFVHHWIFYYTFRNRIPWLVLFGSLLIFSVCYFYLYFGSQTFSEAFFILVQGIALSFVVKNIDKLSQPAKFNKSAVIFFLLLGLVSLIMGITKTLGYTFILGVGTFLLFKRNWKNIIYYAISFSLVFLAYKGLLLLFFDASGLHFEGQLNSLLAKDPYNQQLGNDDIGGLLHRMIDNSSIYLGGFFWDFLGFQRLGSYLSIIIWMSMIGSVIYAYLKKNTVLMMISLYIVITVLSEFIILQKFWSQFRLIVPFYPYIIMIIFFTFYCLLQNKKVYQYVFVILVCFLSYKSFSYTKDKMRDNQKILKSYRRGNKFVGYNRDWINYLKMTSYVKQLPDTALVLCRKPGLAFIYGGRSFAGIYTVPHTNKDDFFLSCSENPIIIIEINNASRILEVPTFSFYRQDILGFFYGKNLKENNNQGIEAQNNYVVFAPNANNMKSIQKVCKENNIRFYLSIDIFKEYLINISCIDPYKIVEGYRNSGIDYVISANLRVDPNRKTQWTISTVKRMMAYTSYKYPTLYTKVHEIGRDETSSLYKMSYQMIE